MRVGRACMGNGGIAMYRRPQLETVERNDRGSIVTTAANGLPRVMDVDEWLYQATRVRAFTPTPADYEPRHRAAS